MKAGRSSFHVAPQYQPLMREIGLDADAVFTHPEIKVWRSIPERENCTLDATLDDRPIRLHIKRYRQAGADQEAKAVQLLQAEQVPTVTLVGWGQIADGRSFIITEDLGGYEAADKMVESGMRFEEILQPTADLAARLHSRNLHHRDLYLCHFFVNRADPSDVRLIDPARVARMNNPLTRARWIRKDLAQFWYSTLSLPVGDEQRSAWIRRYAQQRGLESANALVRSIQGKVRSIRRHDVKLREAQPDRNISIPG